MNSPSSPLPSLISLKIRLLFVNTVPVSCTKTILLWRQVEPPLRNHRRKTLWVSFMGQLQHKLLGRRRLELVVCFGSNGKTDIISIDLARGVGAWDVFGMVVVGDGIFQHRSSVAMCKVHELQGNMVLVVLNALGGEYKVQKAHISGNHRRFRSGGWIWIGHDGGSRGYRMAIHTRTIKCQWAKYRYKQAQVQI